MSELALNQSPPIVRKSRLELQNKLFPWILFGPTILYLFLLTVFPLVYSLYISLFKVPIQRSDDWDWVGLGNYKIILSDATFWNATSVTLLITFAAVTIEVILGVAVALVLVRRLPGMGFFRLLVYLPMMISPMVMGMFWKFMLDGTFGIVNWTIEAFLHGLPDAAFTLAQFMRFVAVLGLIPLAVHGGYWLQQARQLPGEVAYLRHLQQRVLKILGLILGLAVLSFIIPTVKIHIFENGVMGILNPVIEAFGGEPYEFRKIQWTIQPRLAVTSIIMIDVWQWTPFVALLAIAGLQTIPPQLHEAATLDRASKWMQFRRITLPFLTTPLLIAILFRSIDTIKIFDTIWLLTEGGPGDVTQTWSVMVFKLGFRFNGKRGEAAAMSWIMVIFINILVTVILQLVAWSRRRSRMVPIQE